MQLPYLSVFGLYIPFHTVILGVSPYINKLEGSNTVDRYGLYILWFSFDKLYYVITITKSKRQSLYQFADIHSMEVIKVINDLFVNKTWYGNAEDIVWLWYMTTPSF